MIDEEIYTTPPLNKIIPCYCDICGKKMSLENTNFEDCILAICSKCDSERYISLSLINYGYYEYKR